MNDALLGKKRNAVSLVNSAFLNVAIYWYYGAKKVNKLIDIWFFLEYLHL